MPFQNVEELPQDVKNQLPHEAQKIFMTAFNSATADGISEQGAMGIAWNSLKSSYEQDENGNWHPKPEGGAGTNPAGTMPSS